MVSKYTEKNKFGNYTWKIKIENHFYIFIIGADNSSFLVEFKEWKWLNFKTHFTYITNNNLEITINEIFQKVFSFFENNKNYIWTENQKNQKLIAVLQEFQNIGDITRDTKENLVAEHFGFKEEYMIKDALKEAIVSNDEANGIFSYILPPSEETVDEASYFFRQGHLDLAIRSLENFVDNYGDNLSVLILLAKCKMYKGDKFASQILIVKILGMIKNNVGLATEKDVHDFNIVRKEFNSGLLEF